MARPSVGSVLVKGARNIVRGRDASQTSKQQSLEKLIDLHLRPGSGVAAPISSNDAASTLSLLAEVGSSDWQKYARVISAYVVHPNYIPQDVCVVMSALERQRSKDAELHNRIAGLVLRSPQKARSPTIPSRDLIFICFKLLHCKWRGTAASDLFKRLMSRERWAADTSMKDLAGLFFIAEKAKSLPPPLHRQAYDRILEIVAEGATRDASREYQGSNPHKRGSAAQECAHFAAEIAFSMVAIPQCREDAAFMITSLVMIVFTLGGEELTPSAAEKVIAAAAKAKLNVDACPMAFEYLRDKGVSIVPSLTYASKARLLSSVVTLLLHSPSDKEQGGLPEAVREMQLSDLVFCLAEDLSSVEAGEVLRSGELASCFWSLSRLRHENQTHLQGLCSTLRENSALVTGMGPHNVERVLTGLSKLSLYQEDLVVLLLNQLFRFSRKDMATVHLLLIIHCIGSWKKRLHSKQAKLFGEGLLGLLETSPKKLRAELSKMHLRNALAKGLWGLSRLQMLPSRRLLGVLDEVFQVHAGDFDAYETDCVGEWVTFVKNSQHNTIQKMDVAMRVEESKKPPSRYIGAPPTVGKKRSKGTEFVTHSHAVGRRRTPPMASSV
eukprot:TRINITY_DN73109_c0_g1_i1.p1 TRINITY_DN73109_c0_g1~~TRINITY_DN73109_c0_g1_i1.p1  ORF type:complete len:610 (+),score=146.03 TRINITY_DN73109_c0_g1_i1:96-1925(+)